MKFVVQQAYTVLLYYHVLYERVVFSRAMDVDGFKKNGIMLGTHMGAVPP